MPSLSVVRSDSGAIDVHECTFHHFFTCILTTCPRSIIPDANMQLPILGLKCIVETISSVFSIYIIDFIIWQFFFYHFRSLYLKHNLYYGLIITWIVYQYIFITLTLFISYNYSHKATNTSLKSLCFFSFIANVAIFGTIYILLSDDFHMKQNNNQQNQVNKLIFLCNLLNIGDKDHNSYCTIYLSLYYIYANIIVAPASMILTVILYKLYLDYKQKCCGCFQCCCCCKSVTTINDMTNNLEMAMINVSTDASQTLEYKLKLKEEEQEEKKELRVQRNKIEYYLIGYAICWFICLLILYIILLHFIVIQLKLTYYFYSLLVLLTIFKLIFKSICRKIDLISVKISNMNMNRKTNYSKRKYKYKNNNYNNINNINITSNSNSNSNINVISFVSFEMLTEFEFTLFYYLFYYNYFVTELGSINHFSVFIFVSIFHIFSEICQSIMRFSKLYFHLSTKYYDNCLNFCQNHHLSKLEKMIVKIIGDDSTFDEWQTRHSIDVCLRILSLIVAFPVVLTNLLIAGSKTFRIQGNGFKYAILYYFLSFGMDMTYFMCLYLYNNFNIFEPFLKLYDKNNKIVVTIILVGSGFVANVNYFYHYDSTDFDTFVSWF